MRLTRPAVALAVGVSLVLAGSAGAAVKKKVPPPVCNLLTDPAGDGMVDQGSLDIVGGDIASDSKTVTTVVRIAGTDLSKGTIPTGTKIQFVFTVGDQQLFTGATYDPANGLDGYWGHQGDTGGEIEGSVTPIVDAAKKEVRVSVPLSAFATASIKKDTPFSALGANADVIIATPKQALQGNVRPFSNDSATSEATYKSGTKSCVTPGK